jgi:hypothetical protein
LSSLSHLNWYIKGRALHELEGQGHLAHIQAPGALSFLIDTLAGDTPSQKS